MPGFEARLQSDTFKLYADKPELTQSFDRTRQEMTATRLENYSIIPQQTGKLNIPVHFIRGSNSDYINISDELLIKKHFNDFSICTIKGAGHWLHAEKPECFYDEVMGFCLM